VNSALDHGHVVRLAELVTPGLSVKRAGRYQGFSLHLCLVTDAFVYDANHGDLRSMYWNFIASDGGLRMDNSTVQVVKPVTCSVECPAKSAIYVA
jgi:hypothetical protein